MPKMVRHGVLARPGRYHYSWGDEVKTAEELRAAVDRQPSIMLTMGHPASGDANASDVIGRVDQSWDREHQLVDAAFVFYDGEYWDRIPENIRARIVNDEPYPISAGFRVERVEDESQRGILYDHIALLREGENPNCPLGQCGINVRRESKEMSELRYEQATSIVGEKVNTTAPPAPEKPVPVASVELDALRAENVALKAEIAELRRPAPVPTPAAGAAVAEEKKKVEPVPQAPPEPAVIIPAGAPKKGLNIDEATGWLIVGKET